MLQCSVVSSLGRAHGHQIQRQTRGSCFLRARKMPLKNLGPGLSCCRFLSIRLKVLQCYELRCAISVDTLCSAN